VDFIDFGSLSKSPRVDQILEEEHSEGQEVTLTGRCEQHITK